jgi:threonine aldolase
MVDLRSDTVTTPTDGMRRAMMEAEVGDDVFGEDPTVNNLQEKVSAMFGMEAGLFVPSGVMSNQLALKVLTQPAEEVIMDHLGHVFNYEASAASLISSVQINPLHGEGGKLNPELISGAMRSGMEWEPKPSVVVLENTTNKGGGRCYSKKELEAIHSLTADLGLSVHLDGARIWNAMVVTGITPEFFGSIADTMTVSFSKGLGAPVGSMLLSTKENIEQARRFRKMLGGGMRQVGLLAAAADYAVDKHVPLLKEDHRRAKVLAETIASCSHLSTDPATVETNIVIFEVSEGAVSEAITQLEQKGVRMVPFGARTIRATFHFQVGDPELEKARNALTELFG